MSVAMKTATFAMIKRLTQGVMQRRLDAFVLPRQYQRVGPLLFSVSSESLLQNAYTGPTTVRGAVCLRNFADCARPPGARRKRSLLNGAAQLTLRQPWRLENGYQARRPSGGGTVRRWPVGLRTPSPCL